MIDVSGYVAEEKLAIAKQYLLPQAMKESGLNQEKVCIPSSILFFTHFTCLLVNNQSPCVFSYKFQIIP